MSQNIIWITGAQGFIGGNLVQKLRKAGHRPVGFVRKDTALSPRQGACPLYPLSPEGLSAAIAQRGMPARVYPLAGGPTVGRSIADPHSDFLANVATTEILLEALHNLKQRVPVVLASSAAVYGSYHDEPIKTSAKHAPSSPYGYHKLIAEQLVRSHAESFGLPVTIYRLFSIYGPGLRKQLLFDACIRLAAASSGEALELGGTGAERRDWLHVNDVTAAMIAVADPAPGEVSLFNLASGDSTEIRTVANGLVKAWGDSRSVTFSGMSRVGDPFSLVADRGSLPPGFSPSLSLTVGLSEFVAWFREFGVNNERGQ